MARVKWGQNFLADEKWQKTIVSYFDPSADFAEIGPGVGAITNHLEKKFGKFPLFEIDRELEKYHFGRNIIWGDFLDWDFTIDGAQVENFSLISNLPYDSGTKIFLKVCEHSKQISHFVFLLQKEVAERIGAKPQSRDFGSLTVIAQGQYSIQLKDIIPPKAFKPQPEVDSQIIVGRRREHPHSLDRSYLQFLKAAFAQKRKTLKNNLKSLGIDFEALISEFKMPSTVRAEEIDVDVWPLLYKKVEDGRQRTR